MAGMEEASSWTSPFRPTGTWPAGVGVATVAAVADAAAPSLESLFPKLYGRFHSATSYQKCLEISFVGASGATAEVVRYVEPVAVGDYRAFAFFARQEVTGDTGAPVLTVTLGDAGAALSAAVPLDDVVATSRWRRFVVRYDGVPKLYRQNVEGGAEELVAAVVPLSDPSVSEIGRAHV